MPIISILLLARYTNKGHGGSPEDHVVGDRHHQAPRERERRHQEHGAGGGVGVGVVGQHPPHQVVAEAEAEEERQVPAEPDQQRRLV